MDKQTNKPVRTPIRRANEGMDEFCEKVAKELLKTFPDVDVYDLRYVFDTQFAFKYLMEAFYSQDAA